MTPSWLSVCRIDTPCFRGRSTAFHSVKTNTSTSNASFRPARQLLPEKARDGERTGLAQMPRMRLGLLVIAQK